SSSSSSSVCARAPFPGLLGPRRGPRPRACRRPPRARAPRRRPGGAPCPPCATAPSGGTTAGGRSAASSRTTGAPNGTQVPPQPGGLFHGTRVSYTPVALEAGAGGAGKTVCFNTLPLAGQAGLSVGVECIAAAKDINDDRVCAADLWELGFLAGVFDGHRGFLCSDFVSQQMPSAVLAAYRARAKKARSIASLSAAQEASLICGAIEDAFDATDRAWLQHAKKRDLVGGSTGLVALLSHGFEAPPAPPALRPGTVAAAPGGVAKLFVAWCGDSRAVLCRGRRGVRLSEDHKPSTEAERARIQAAGGHVMQDPWGTWRVGREEASMLKELQQLRQRKATEQRESWLLSTSRSFGDVELKVPDSLVIAQPEVRAVDLTPEDWAVVLACDGVFDVLSDQEVAEVVQQHHADPVQAAKAVVQRAIDKESRDNLTAIVLRLGWSPAPGVRRTSAALDPNVGMFG
ncbi:unnamed protein product, partial [Prorocentrum cordatum]